MGHNIPVLETERLQLIPLGDSPDDAADVQRFIDDPDIIKFLHFVPYPYPADGGRTFVESQKVKMEKGCAVLWGIHLKENPAETIGLVHYWELGGTDWERGFWLAKKCHGRGYMTEAVAVTLDFIFGELRVKRILMENMHGNEASRRIKTKTGAKFLGVFPFEKPCKGFTHQDRWEMTAEMWQRAKEKGL